MLGFFKIRNNCWIKGFVSINGDNQMILLRSLNMVHFIIILSQPCIPGINPLSHNELFSMWCWFCLLTFIFCKYFAPIFVSDICLSINVILLHKNNLEVYLYFLCTEGFYTTLKLSSLWKVVPRVKLFRHGAFRGENSLTIFSVSSTNWSVEAFYL